MTVSIRPFVPAIEEDVAWAEQLVDRMFGGRMQAVRGTTFDALALPGFIAELDGRRSGIATHRPLGPAVEIALLIAEPQRQGIGRLLVEAVREAAGERPVRVVTTNDNLDALRFYQRRGFRLVELRPGAVDEARRTIKPEIGRVGAYDIPLRDELELEWRATA